MVFSGGHGIRGGRVSRGGQVNQAGRSRRRARGLAGAAGEAAAAGGAAAGPRRRGGAGLGVPVSVGLGVGALTWNCAHGFCWMLTATQMMWGPGGESGIVTPRTLMLPSLSGTAAPSDVLGLSKSSPTACLGGKFPPVMVTWVPGGPDEGLTWTHGGGPGGGGLD